LTGSIGEYKIKTNVRENQGNYPFLVEQTNRQITTGEFEVIKKDSPSGRVFLLDCFRAVAQLAERPSPKRKVPGSTPGSPAK
jgi:hypothetical protein